MLDFTRDSYPDSIKVLKKLYDENKFDFDSGLLSFEEKRATEVVSHIPEVPSLPHPKFKVNVVAGSEESESRINCTPENSQANLAVSLFLESIHPLASRLSYIQNRDFLCNSYKEKVSWWKSRKTSSDELIDVISNVTSVVTPKDKKVG